MDKRKLDHYGASLADFSDPEHPRYWLVDGPDRINFMAELVKRYNAYPELIEAMDSLLRHCVTPNGMPDANKGRTQEQQAALDKTIKLLKDSKG